MSKLPKIIAIVLYVAGGILIVAGAVTYAVVKDELSDEKIVVSDDADRFAGDAVEGPLTAYSEAETIKQHASEIADGQTYAQLDQDDPRRESVMTASFLRASLFTSVVAFGVAVLVIGLGILFILVGLAIWALDRNLRPALVEERTVIAEDAVAPPPPADPTT